MKTKPRWLATERPNQVAMIVQNVSNSDDCEVFMIEFREGSIDKMIFEGCVEATNRIIELIDNGQYFKNEVYNYTQKKKIINGTVTSGVGISIPSQRRSKQFENRFELLAEVLAMNGINFRRPAMGVYAI